MNYEISKVDGEHFLLGVIMVPAVRDLAGDTVDEMELSRAIAKYNDGPQKVKRDHDVAFAEDDVRVVESYQAPADFFIGGTRVPKGAWIAKFRVSQKIYELAAAGQITGFSVGGVSKAMEQ